MPTQVEIMLRDKVVTRIKSMILEIWPNVYVKLFGSTLTGLYLPNSDIDFNVQGVLDSFPLQRLHAILLSTDTAEPNTVDLVDRPLFPLIRFIDRESQIKIDITCSKKRRAVSSNLVMQFIREYPVFPKLFMVLKQFLNQRDLKKLHIG